MENKKRAAEDVPKAGKRHFRGDETRHIVKALIGFRPKEPISYIEWLNQLDDDGVLTRIARSLDIPKQDLRKKYRCCHIHRTQRPLAMDVSSPKYWNLWAKMYSWDDIEEMARKSRAKYTSEAASELSHSETEDSPDEDPHALDETIEKNPEEVSKEVSDSVKDTPKEVSDSVKDTPKDSPGENLKHEGVPRAIYIGKYDRGYGSLTELRYNAETLTAELYLPGDTDVLPQIHHTRAGNICADMGYGRVMVLTANRHMPVKVYHETIQVAPDRDPAFLRLRIVYEKV